MLDVKLVFYEAPEEVYYHVYFDNICLTHGNNNNTSLSIIFSEMSKKNLITFSTYFISEQDMRELDWELSRNFLEIPNNILKVM